MRRIWTRGQAARNDAFCLLLTLLVALFGAAHPAAAAVDLTPWKDIAGVNAGSVADLTFAGPLMDGTPVQVIGRLHNRGDVTLASADLTVQLSSDVGDNLDLAEGSSQALTGITLAPGASLEVTWTWTPHLADGVADVRFGVDTSNVIAEGNEGNNLTLGAVRILPSGSAVASSTRTVAGSATVTAGSWFMPGQAVSHNSFCASTVEAARIALTGYGFTLPATAIVTGVAVKVWATVESVGGMSQLRLLRPDAVYPRNLAAPAGGCGAAAATAGGERDLWVSSAAFSPLTAADVNDSAFGVDIAGDSPNGVSIYHLDSAEITVHYALPPPGAPTALQATAQPGLIHLTWTDGAAGTASFSIERDVGAGYSEIATRPAGTTTFDDATVACAASYSYRVRAVRSSDGAVSPYSNTAAISPFPCPDLTATKSAEGSPAAVGEVWTWRVVVANDGTDSAAFAAGTTVFVDQLPAALYAAPTATPGPGVLGSAVCDLATLTWTCTAGPGGLTLPAGTSLDLTLDGHANAAGDLDNGGSSCAIDPDELIEETNEGNNNCNVATVTVRDSDIFSDDFASGNAQEWSVVVP